MQINKQILDFCKTYAEKVKTDKDIKENPSDGVARFHDYRDRIEFVIAYNRWFPYSTNMPNYINLFFLDNEDLQYLYNKYSKQIEAEKDANIAVIESEYDIKILS